MKVQDVPMSGKRGRIVAFKSRFGQCEREHTRPTRPRTAAQSRASSDFGRASLGWNGLTEKQREAWCEFSKKVHSHPRGGQSGPLTGQNLFTALNRNQALLGLPPFLYPPERPVFDPIPVEALTITEGRAGIALKLTLTEPPTGHVLVYASRPYNAGRHYCDKFICLGPLPAPRAGQTDITALYVKVSGEPWPGSRVILRIVQQVNGWRSLPHRIETVFRPDQAPKAQPNLRRASVPAP